MTHAFPRSRQVSATPVAPPQSLHDNRAMDRPDTRFAWNGDVSLAYQVCGDGPTDLVYIQGYCSNVDVNWESPHPPRLLRGLAGHPRPDRADPP